MTAAHVHEAVRNAAKFKPKANGDGRPEVSRGYDAADLVAMDMPDPAYICRPWIAEGVTLLVGRPKVGKTTMLRQLALQANVAGRFFTAPCQSTQVLFLSLEEGDRLMRKKLAASGATQEMLRGIRMEFEWPQGAAGVERMREWLQARDATRLPLIVIDSLTRFRIPPSDRGNAFTEDYNTVKSLADLCKEFPGLAIVILHHTTKAMPDDPVSAISGTYGLSAATENYLIILKQGEQFR
jgi:RecA-family ATPase